MEALTVDKIGIATVKRVSIPTLDKGEILVKVHSVALNPSDWKYRDLFGEKFSGLGSDFSGIVSSISEEVENVKVGDRVAGLIHGGLKGVGSFAEYLKTDYDLVWKVPESISFEEAAALGGAGPHTAFQSLFLSQKLARPDNPTNNVEAVLIWGGSSSVGMYAIQLAKLSGYTVISTASPINFELLKSLGATEVFDYKNPLTPSKIHSAFPHLVHALDCVSQNGTTSLVAASLGFNKSEKAKITILQPLQVGTLVNVEGIEIEMNNAYKLCGKAFNWGGIDVPADPEARREIVAWLKFVPTLIESGKLKANPISKQSGGLHKINEGLELLKAGKVSAQKLVYNIAST